MDFMSEAIGRVNEIFETVKRRNSLIVVEKHGGALRNSYTDDLPAMKPDVVLCDTPAWSDDQPDHVFAAENYTTNRDESVVTARETAMQDCIEYTTRPSSKRPIVYSWFGSSQIDMLAESADAEALVSRDEHVCSSIEDKSRLQKYLVDAGCHGAQTPERAIFSSSLALPSFADIREFISVPFVLQGKSMGGDGTYIVSSNFEYDNARENLIGGVRLSEFIDAPYSSIYCLSLPNATGDKADAYVDMPSHKPVNVAELGVGNVVGAGGDWRSQRDDCDMESIVCNIQKLAQHFYQKWGYFGHFVVEGFHTENGFLFNEINARPGGGSEVNSCYQFDREAPSFTSLHILGRLGMVNSTLFDSNAYNEETVANVKHGVERGAIYLKYKNGGNVSVNPASGYKGSGIYALDGEALVWQRDAAATKEAMIDNSEFLLSNGPREGAGVGVEKQICSFEAHGERLIFDENLQLNRTGRLLARAAQRLFGIQERGYLR